jgi:hypothetical protein
MSAFIAKIKLPVFVGSVVVFPFVLLELINRRSFNEPFPFPLFVVLWFLPVLFVSILVPTIKKVKAVRRNKTDHIFLFLGFALSILIAWLWIDLMRDQMPCFLGVPNCD